MCLFLLRSCGGEASASTITCQPPTGRTGGEVSPPPVQHGATQRPGPDGQPQLPLQQPAKALEVQQNPAKSLHCEEMIHPLNQPPFSQSIYLSIEIRLASVHSVKGHKMSVFQSDTSVLTIFCPPGGRPGQRRARRCRCHGDGWQRRQQQRWATQRHRNHEARLRPL